ncbi:MAG: hypothetical protein DI538_01300 [Azospira oryzae]|jgi:hypothetical protein|nr:MAG: hypothetical protein DI538_01300 [Azospira oryzae]
MKNLLLTGALLVSASLCYAQSDSTKAAESAKAVKGNVTTELNVNLFQGDLKLNNALQQIKVRYFIKEGLALRIGFNFTSSKDNSDVSNPYGNSPYTYTNTSKTSTVSLNGGIEKHFKGTKRLSPYVGAELSLANKSSSQETSTGNSTLKVKGAWQTYTYNGNGLTATYSERAYFKFGVNLVCGFDYYFAKNFYAGYEFLFQFNTTNYKDIDVTSTPTANQPSTPTPRYDDSESFVGPSLINGIRIGFIF